MGNSGGFRPIKDLSRTRGSFNVECSHLHVVILTIPYEKTAQSAMRPVPKLLWCCLSVPLLFIFALSRSAYTSQQLVQPAVKCKHRFSILRYYFAPGNDAECYDRRVSLQRPLVI